MMIKTNTNTSHSHTKMTAHFCAYINSLSLKLSQHTWSLIDQLQLMLPLLVHVHTCAIVQCASKWKDIFQLWFRVGTNKSDSRVCVCSISTFCCVIINFLSLKCGRLVVFGWIISRWVDFGIKVKKNANEFRVEWMK